MERQAWDANDTAANWEGLWGTVAAPQVLPSTSSPLLPPPLQQHLGNLFLLHHKRCPDYCWKPPVPSDLSLASTLHRQRRSLGTAALGCCPRGARQQKGAGRGLHRWGLLCLKCLPCSGWARRGGRMGMHGGCSPLVLPPAFQHATEPQAPWETPLGHSGQCGSAFGAFICFQGHSPRSRRQNVLAPRGGFCCFPPAEDTFLVVSVG